MKLRIALAGFLAFIPAQSAVAAGGPAPIAFVYTTSNEVGGNEVLAFRAAPPSSCSTSRRRVAAVPSASRCAARSSMC